MTRSPGGALESAGRKSGPQNLGLGPVETLVRCPAPLPAVAPEASQPGAHMGLPAVFPGWVWGSLEVPGEFLGGAQGVLTWGPRGQHQGSGHNQ